MSEVKPGEMFNIDAAAYSTWRATTYRMPQGRWAWSRIMWAMAGISEADQRAKTKQRKPRRIRKLRTKGRRKNGLKERHR